MKRIDRNFKFTLDYFPCIMYTLRAPSSHVIGKKTMASVSLGIEFIDCRYIGKWTYQTAFIKGQLHVHVDMHISQNWGGNSTWYADKTVTWSAFDDSFGQKVS